MSDASSQNLAPPSSQPTDALKAESSSQRPLAIPVDDQMTVISTRPPARALPQGHGGSPLDCNGLVEGDQLGQFTLQKFIGGGGMGVVFRALDTTLNRDVAVKVLSYGQAADEEALRRFRNEAQSAARLNHDNIARVHYVGEDRGVHYIVFEFIDGINIRDMVEARGPLPLDEALSYTYQVAQAIQHAHQRDVIHRDIKPSNVLVTRDGQAKLVDMGLARLNQVAPANDDLTASGVTLGTFDYISPEQARDPRGADVRSDLYSLGCSFYYMLTGRPPFPDGTVLQKLLKHQADVPPDPRALRPELPSEVARILNRLLAKNPAQRYQEPAQLIADLTNMADRLGLPLSSSRLAWTPPPPAAPSRLRFHLPWLVPMSILLLAVMAIDFFGSWGMEPADALPPASNGQKADLSKRNGSLPNSGKANDARTVPNAVPEGTRRSTKTFRPIGDPTLDDVGPTVDGDDRADPPPAPPDEFPESTTPEAALDLGPSAPSVGMLDTSAEATAPAAKSVGSRERVLTVGDTTGPMMYPTLRAACHDARNGDVIELRFNGRRVERPIELPNLRITIRAASEFYPIVAFQTTPDASSFAPFSQSMFSLAGGRVQVHGVHWELDLPRDVPADWSMFESLSAHELVFHNSTFTIRNVSLGQSAYHPNVAFFDVKAVPGTGGMDFGLLGTDEGGVRIELHDCIARGEATFVRSDEQQPMRLSWTNGLLAAEHFLTAAGGPWEPHHFGALQCELRHVTLAVHGGFALLTNKEDSPFQLNTQIDATDCIFVGQTTSPFVEQRGSDTIEEFTAQLQWLGDRTYFEGFEPLWRIRTLAGPRVEMSFGEWQAFWQEQAHGMSDRGIVWRRLPPANRPFQAQGPEDYAVSSSTISLATSADGVSASPLGFIAAQLPALPPPPAEARAPR